MLVTVNNPPSTDRGYCWAFVDFFKTDGTHVKHELKHGTNKTVSVWLGQVIGGLEIVDKEAVLFLQAKNGTG